MIEKTQEQLEVEENMAHDDRKQEGQHSEKWCNIGLRTGKPKLVCADCQRASENIEIKPEFNAYSSKDRRISWLSIFSSLTQTFKILDLPTEDRYEIINNIKDRAYELNEELYRHYPTEEK